MSTEKKAISGIRALCNFIKSFVVSQISRLGHLSEEQKSALLQKCFRVCFIHRK